MKNANEEIPTYNLKAVIYETGLTPATLRAWERRYGLLKPQRSPGGHRLYTRAEIEMLKWLVERQAEGLSISHAIEMWRQQDGSPALRTPSYSVLMPVPTSGTMLDQLRSSWVTACLAYDEQAAEQALVQAMALASPEAVCSELLQKGLAEIGEGWAKGTVSVQQEHFASALVVRRLNTLIAGAPAPTRPVSLLAACPPGETHDLALLMLAFILRWHGWEVVYLGPDVPLARLDVAVRAIRPGLALSVAQTLTGAASLRQLADFVNAQDIMLAYGGGIFDRIPDLTEQIPGHYLGSELGAVPQRVERLLASRPMPANSEVDTARDCRCAGKFQAERNGDHSSCQLRASKKPGGISRAGGNDPLFYPVDHGSSFAWGDALS